MLNVSQKLLDAVESPSQYVTPKVVVRFGDNRFLRNVKTTSSNDFYSDVVLSLNPKLYWKFFNKNSTNFSFTNNTDENQVFFDYSNNQNVGKIFGSFNNNFPLTQEYLKYIDNIDHNFSNPDVPENFGLNNSEYINNYVFYADEDQTIPFFFNLNRNLWFNSFRGGTQLLSFAPTAFSSNEFLDYAVVETGSFDGKISVTLGVLLQELSNISIKAKNKQGIVFRFIDEKNYNIVYLDSLAGIGGAAAKNVLTVREVRDGQSFILGHFDAQWSGSSWSDNEKIGVEMAGSLIRVYRTISGQETLLSTTIANGSSQSHQSLPYVLSSTSVDLSKATRHGVGAEGLAQLTDYGGLLGANSPVWTSIEIDVKEYLSYSAQSGATDSYVRCDDVKLDLNKEATFSFAFKVEKNAHSTTARLMQAYFIENNERIPVVSIDINNGKLRAIVAAKEADISLIKPTTLEYTPETPFEVGSWYLCTLSIDHNEVRLYLDGNLVASFDNYIDNVMLKKITRVALFRKLEIVNAVQVWSYFDGSIDEFFIINKSITENNVEKLYNLSIIENSFIEGRTIFNSNQAFNIIEEETYPYNIFNLKNKNNNINSLNGEYYVSNSKINITNSYYFASSEISDENGDFDEGNQPYVQATFDPIKVNKIVVSTGFELGRISSCSVKYKNAATQQYVDLGPQSFNGDSILTLTLNNTVLVDEIQVDVASTAAPQSRAIIHQVNLFYEEDVSEDVIGLDFAKIRDNYEATLPIGSTSANNGKVTLDNSHRKYNSTNTESPYHGYIRPHVKASLSLVYHFEDETSEELLLGDLLFVESWNVSSDTMTVDLDLLDWSVVLQDLTSEGGFVFEDVTAGRAAREVVRSSGFPSRKIQYYDTFYKAILADQPIAHWRLNDRPGSLIQDDAGDFDAIASNPSGSIVLGAEPVIPHEKNADIDNNSRSLALLYKITAENVGMESPKDPFLNYSARVETGASKNFADFPLVRQDDGRLGSTPESFAPEDEIDWLDDFSIELVFKVSDFSIVDEEVPGQKYTIISKRNNDEVNYEIAIEKGEGIYVVTGRVDTNEDSYICSHEFTEAEFLNKLLHIVFTKTSEKIQFWVNGEVDECLIDGLIVTNNDPLRMLGIVDDEVLETFAGATFDGPIESFAVQPDGKILVGGSFEYVNNQKASKIVRLNSDGTIDKSFVYLSSPETISITSIAATNAKIYIGFSELYSYPGFDVTFIRMSRLNLDGSFDIAFGVPGPTKIVDIIPYDNGKVLVKDQNSVTRYNSNGSSDTGFDAQPLTVASLANAVLDDNEFIFTEQDQKIVKLNADGSINNSFNAPSIGVEIYSLDIQDDGKIVVGYSGGIYRLNTNGSLDTSFNSGESGPNGPVFKVRFYDDSIVLFGNFTTYNGSAVNKIIKINLDGTLDSNFNQMFNKNIFINELLQNNFFIDNNKVIFTNQNNSNYKLEQVNFNILNNNNLTITLSHIAIYNKKLNQNEIIKHYITSTLDRLPVFPYLYFFDTTYWDGLLEIATADVGMFYFNENNIFVYDHKNAFHDIELKNSSETQYTFDANKNIINANYVLDIESNKIVVKVNPKSKISAASSALWRAETGESLAVTKLSRNLSSTALDAYVSNTENPIWPRSGYLKIDDEIIKYNNREINRLTELERGQFDTNPTAHNAGAKCRETRVYDFEFTEKPAISVQYPLLIAQVFEDRADIDKFETTPFGGTAVVSASDVSRNNPDDTDGTGNLVYLEGTNPVTEKEYFFAISGVPLTEKVSEEKVRDEVRETALAERSLRPRELVIDNKFIQTTSYAREVADFVLTYFGRPVPVIQVESMGLPFLQLGDLIKIENFEDMNLDNAYYWVIESSISYDGGIQQSFMLRKNNYVI